MKFRNTYDSDNTVFSPQGRIHQVEYSLEAVKQGSAVVGLRSKTHAILLALKVCDVAQPISKLISDDMSFVAFYWGAVVLPAEDVQD